MEKIFSFAWKGKRGIGNEQEEGKDDKGNGPQDTYVNDDQGLQRRHNVDTFLQVIHWTKLFIVKLAYNFI